MTLIIGLPNAGKTTFSDRFANVYHRDGMNPSELEEIIKQDGVVIEGLFSRRNTRKSILRKASKPCRCIWLDTPIDVCKKRETRGRKNGFFEMHNRLFEPPTLDEGWDEIIIVRGDHEQIS